MSTDSNTQNYDLFLGGKDLHLEGLVVAEAGQAHHLRKDGLVAQVHVGGGLAEAVEAGLDGAGAAGRVGLEEEGGEGDQEN